MVAYIQKDHGQIPDDWIFSAMLGFKNKGFKIKFFEEKNITIIPCNMKTIVIGYIEPIIRYFQYNSIEVPKPLNIPDQLNNQYLLGREIGLITMGELKAIDNTPIFVKPYGKVKQFDSGVLEKHDTKKYVFNGISDDTLVQTSTLIDFVSEYRCFVHKGELRGIQWYKGDFTIFPNPGQIQTMISMYKNAPVAYTLDVGVKNRTHGIMTYDPLTLKSNEKTYLVECNDLWSVGHYGLRDDIYSTLLRDRWFEIIRNHVKN